MLDARHRFRGAASCLFLVALGAASRAEVPIAGPENEGLRLRLCISSAEHQDSGLLHRIRLEVLNSAAEPVTLLGQWADENDGDYTAHLRSAVGFVTFPELPRAPTSQTGERARKSPQPEYTLGPGETLAVKWEVPDSLRCLDRKRFYPRFQFVGLYGIRARAVLQRKNGERVLLISNEAQLAVGGSSKLPKFSVGRVVHADQGPQTASIDIGSDHRVEVGDVFWLRRGSGRVLWRLTITKTMSHSALGSLEAVPQVKWPKGKEVPFARQGWIALISAAWERHWARRSSWGQAPKAAAFTGDQPLEFDALEAPPN